MTGEVVGLDFSGNMLKVGQEKVERRGLGERVRLVRGNAMELPFPDDTLTTPPSALRSGTCPISGTCCGR